MLNKINSENKKDLSDININLNNNTCTRINNILNFPNSSLQSFWKNIFWTELPDKVGFSTNKEFIEIVYKEFNMHVKNMTQRFFPQNMIWEYKKLLDSWDEKLLLDTILNNFRYTREQNTEIHLHNWISKEDIWYHRKSSSWPETVNRSLLPNCFYSSAIWNELFKSLWVKSKFLNIPWHVINYIVLPNSNEYLIDMQNKIFIWPTKVLVDWNEPIEIVNLNPIKELFWEIKYFAPKWLIFNDPIKGLWIMFWNISYIANVDENWNYESSYTEELTKKYKSESNWYFFNQIRNINDNIFSEYRKKMALIRE